MKKVYAIIAGSAAFLTLGIVGGVELGAPLINMIPAAGALAVSIISSRMAGWWE